MNSAESAALASLAAFVRSHPVIEWCVITASREYGRPSVMRAAFELLPQSCRLRHGAARGGDRLAGQIWGWLGRSLVEFPVTAEQWRLTRRAGFDRNQQMVDAWPLADVGLAFVRDDSHGALDCQFRMIKADIPTFVFPYRTGK